ncbi:MAG: hypothetical protein L3K06_07195 [Thermoplasmata archaeon]|nr:hypothetical protein [Thermoplasmata archaeon]
MASKLIKTVGLIILAAALTAPVASAMRTDEPGSSSGTPATVVLPNDRAGTQGVGQAYVDPVGIGGQTGLHLIENAQADPIGMGGQTGLRLIRDTQTSQPDLRPVSATGDGFNWGTVGLGAAGFLALATTVMFLTAVSRRSRQGDIALS